MTLGFEELQVGDVVEFKGPLGSFEWLGNGSCRWRGVERKVKNIGMICGGSGASRSLPGSRCDANVFRAGITPILQVLRGVIYDEQDKDTKLYVLNANKTEADILMRAELDELSRLAGPERLRQHLVLSKGSDDWAGSLGRIGKDHLVKYMPPASPDSLILMCAPPPMQDMVVAHLAEMGWDVATQVVIF